MSNLEKKVQKTNDFTLDFRLQGIRPFRMICFSTNNTALRTDSRDGHTITFIEGKGYIIGGVSRFTMETMVYFEALKEKFHTLKMDGLKPDERSFHTAVAVKKYIYMLGGEITSGIHANIRTISNELWRYDTSQNDWGRLVCTGVYVPPRKAHAAVTFGKIMVVFGGICDDLKYSNDFYVFSIGNLYFLNQ